MQRETHAFFVRAAVAIGGSSWRQEDVPRLLEGDRDEDDLVVPILGLRLRAAGLTHTHRPGRRFGELFAESARTKLLRCVARANAAPANDLDRRAWWLGRACHLLGDMAVPARTRGVWHLEGDPLEAFCEREASRGSLGRLVPSSLTPAEPRDPAALADALARASSRMAADTTRTPWGRLAWTRLGRGVRLDPETIASQAEALVPLAVAHVAALLACVPRP
jgi:hypothetical protein